MKRATGWLALVVGCGLLSAVPAWAQGKEAAQKTYEVKIIADVAYNDSKEADPEKHKLDLYLPEGKKDFPVVLYVHGGGWTKGTRKAGTQIGKTFAKHGIGVASMSYRLSPAVTHPAHIEDTAQAFDWTYRNIGKYGGRNDEIFVSGHSAGGHLVALLATDPQYLKKYGLSLSNIRGAIPISGVFTIAPGKMVKTFGNDPDVAKQASPLSHCAKNCPPFLILYAEKDIPALRNQAQEFAAALKKIDAAVQSQEFEGRNHGSIVGQIAKEGDPVAQRMLEFIRKHTVAKSTSTN